MKFKKCKEARQSVTSCIGTQQSYSMGSEMRYKIAQSPLYSSSTRNTETASHRTPSANRHSQRACKLAAPTLAERHEADKISTEGSRHGGKSR